MFMENSEDRRMREMREIEMMMEHARFRAAMQKINEQRSGQSSSSSSGAAGAAGAAGGGSLIHKTAGNQYVEEGYIESGYFE